MKRKALIVEKMILLYLHKNQNREYTYGECMRLIAYTKKRSAECITNEFYCSDCKASCYSREMRDKIRVVMKYSGPKMIIYHPILAVEYLIRKGGKKWKS